MPSLPTLDGKPPIVIAHRGASGLYPEHTLAGYEAAIGQGADFIEPDLMFTRDGVLVARHDAYLSTTTDVAAHPEFLGRRRWSWAFGQRDWFIEDFTLPELKRLRARQRWPGRPQTYDGRFEIPTFDEVLLLAKTQAAERGRPVGVYPEAKYPKHFARRGRDFATPLLGTLKAHGAGGSIVPIIIQSFDPWILKRLKPRTDLPLILLCDLGVFLRARLKRIARFAFGIGPSKTLVARNRRSTGLIEAAHKAGLAVHIYTLRDDQVGEGFRNVEEELEFYYRLGVDGVFADFPASAVEVRKRLVKR
jgi:glycerophosphoryl diester phosphodiesterase